jgi:hypothetical protein
VTTLTVIRLSYRFYLPLLLRPSPLSSEYLIRDPLYEASVPSLDPSVDTGEHSRSTRISGQQEGELPNPIPSQEDTQEPGGGKWSEILDRLIFNLSDQQLPTSIAILVTAFIRSCEISNYHLNIVCDLAWFSAIMHLLSVIVLRVYWTRQSKKTLIYIRPLSWDSQAWASHLTVQ